MVSDRAALEDMHSYAFDQIKCTGVGWSMLVAQLWGGKDSSL